MQNCYFLPSPQRIVCYGLSLALLFLVISSSPGDAQDTSLAASEEADLMVQAAPPASPILSLSADHPLPEAIGDPAQSLELVSPTGGEVAASKQQLVAPSEDPFPSPLEDPLGATRWILAKSSEAEQDLSPIGMYRSADIVVKLVMLGLAFASLVTWTVWVAKTLELWGARSRARRALQALERSETLSMAQAIPRANRGAVGRMLTAASQEAARSEPALKFAGGAGLKERVAAALGRIEAHAGRRMARGTGVLATIGSTAPFVGLFGTVWGILNAFISIAESNTTNLAVVAPGIAEALLATAIGLVAAIPAVIIYNLFARSVAGYRHLLGDAGERIERLISRDLDMRAVSIGQASTSEPHVLQRSN